MLSYHQYEETVINWLHKRREKHPEFTFSVRVRKMKGSENDYFIGTEKSGYFATTFWLIPVSFPGSSADCIDLLFGYATNGYQYNFEFSQTMTPLDGQNSSALNLVRSVRDKIESHISIQRDTGSSAKMYTLKTKPKKPSYSSVDEMLEDIWTDLNYIFPVIDEVILIEKAKNPDFIAERISTNLFEKNLNRMIARRYQNSTHQMNKVKENQESFMNSDGGTPLLNQILYGPPGTGKTYTTIDKVVEICEPDKYIKDDHDSNKAIYNTLVKEDRVVFTTFHQSMAYEDFIEGIKPVIGDEDHESNDAKKTLEYNIEEGVFKKLCSSAKSYNEFLTEQNGQHFIDPKLLKGKNYFKVSLGNTLSDTGDIIYNYCKDNSCIAIGWGGDDIDYSGVKDRKEVKERFSAHGYDESEVFHISAIERLAIWMKKGDVVFVSHGNSSLKAVGIIEGDYEHRPSSQLPFNGYNHFRKVKWLILDAHIPVHEVYYANFSQQSIYMMWHDRVKKDFFTTAIATPKNKNHVLVIDEINRGNVSSIFGELITLIEEDKRLGADNELTVTLPYSKEKFGVPPNLYILGTMNTADRSVEVLDTALRRRFSFVEMLPEPHLLKQKGQNESGLVEGINLGMLLQTINDRIEALVDRDHTIGHAYFMKVDSVESLQETFANNIIPLLQEYFYGNYIKMEMVIGPYFFKKDLSNQKVVFAVNNEDVYESSSKRNHLHNISKMNTKDFLDAIRRLVNPTFEKVVPIGALESTDEVTA